MGSSGKLITSAQILDSTIATADIAAGAVTVLQLDYVASTDILTGPAIASTTWTDVCPNQTFTVTASSSRVEITVRGGMSAGNMATSQAMGTRLVVDSAGTPIIRGLGCSWQQVVNRFENPLAGSGPVQLSGLSVGSHTVKVQVFLNAAGVAYLRAATQADYEHLAIQVTEHLR